MRRSALLLALSGVALATLITPAAAKAQASITATANVASTLGLSGDNDLDFQLVIPGFTKTVPVTDASAGAFSISGGPGAQVTFSFTSLPANLTDGGGNNLPITYTAVYNTANDPATGNALPLPGGAVDVLSPLGELFIFLGGTVDAIGPPVPPNGTYTGTVTLTASYTGN
jgi:hypothetical protein